MFTLDVCVCVNVQHCVNVKCQEWFCDFIDAMLYFEGDVDANANANAKCENTFNHFATVLHVEWSQK